MKNKMKKVIAIILSISIIGVSVHMQAFAEPNDFLGYYINTLENNRKEALQNKSFSQKVWNYLFSDNFDLAMSAIIGDLISKAKFTNQTGIEWTKKEIDDAAKNIFNISVKSQGSLFNWIKSALFGPYSFLTLFLAMKILDIVKNFYNDFKTKIQAGKIEKPVDPVATMQVLDVLMANIKGQENAKKQIRSIVLNIVDKNAQFMLNKNHKTAGPGSNVIYMVGPSGVGKSFSADIIRKVLSGFNSEPFIIEASDIDKQSKSSPVEQLFGMKVKRINNSEVYEYAPFIQRIKAIPNTTVIINEYDKMHSPELDEKLRTIIDQGYINVNGEKIDCSGVTFIITSNESSASAKKGNLESDMVDDGTGSRTFINHDKAFLNRIKLIEFDNLSAEEYKQIATPLFVKLAARYKMQYKIDLDLNGTIDEVAKKTEELNRGARPIFTFIEMLNTKILNEIVLKRSLNGDDSPIFYRVSFNGNDFSLEKHN